MKPKLGLKFNFVFQSINKNTGKITKELKFKNMVVNSGLDAVADLIAAEFNYLAIGTGDTAATANDTELEAEFDREEVTATNEGVGIRKYDKTFEVGSGVSEEIQEAGLFNSATPSGSIMLNRAIAAESFTLDIDNPLRVIATITVSSGV